MNLFKVCIVTILLLSISTTSLLAEIYFMDTCLVKTDSFYVFPPNHSTVTFWQENLETWKYCCNEEFDINKGFTDKTAYINNLDFFYIQNLLPVVYNNPPGIAQSGQPSEIDNITKLIYLLNSSFLI
jgi:hypothetical protein